MLNNVKFLIAKKNIIILATSLFFLSSCEKVIDLPLDDNSTKVVIEGSITNQVGPYLVKVTKSVTHL
jgi:hypothetical protein